VLRGGRGAPRAALPAPARMPWGTWSVSWGRRWTGRHRDLPGCIIAA